MELTAKALKLILDYEVGGGEGYYKAALQRPTWPGGESGVTIGIGYDLGYTPGDRFAADWEKLPDEYKRRLSKCLGSKGNEARSLTGTVRDIIIPWPVAFEVFQKRTVPFWIAQTQRAFPGVERLPGDAAGALVSLVFNRGTSVDGSRRKEMAEIKALLADGVQAGDLAKIAEQLRAMKRLWVGKGLPGLIKRREAEAQLVEGASF